MTMTSGAMARLVMVVYGMVFSLCTLATMSGLFYRRIKRFWLFPVLAGALFGADVYVQTRLTGAVDITFFYAAHTLAAFLILAEKRWDHFIALVCAELFSGCLISSVRTALFSVFNGGGRSFGQTTVLHLTGCLAAAGFVLVLGRLMRSEDREPLGLMPVILLTAVVFTATILVDRSFSMSDYVPDVSPQAAVPSVLMLMSVTVLLLLSVRQQQAKRFREMNELSEKFMTAQARHFEQSRDADTGMRMLRHDMKNHITVMNGLLSAGKTEELGEYLRELGTAFSDTQAVNITGNEIADAIITEKKSAAEAMGGRLVTEGSLKGLRISAVMLCTVLSDLLDNAIEAAALTDKERVINLSAKRSGSFYYICITNPAAVPVDVSADIPTSKPQSSGHGLGLKSVKRAIEKCGGTLELSCREAGSGYIFTAEVILPAGAGEEISEGSLTE